MSEVEHLIPVRGDLQNTRISMVEHLNVVGALLLQIVYGIRHANENIPRLRCDDVGGLLRLNQPWNLLKMHNHCPST